MGRDARFYPIDGEDVVSVTTFLSIIDKSQPLMHWAVNQERRKWEIDLLNVLSHEKATDPEWVLGQLAKPSTEAKAMVAEQDKAKTIGTAAHAMIEWRTRKLLGESVGDEPIIPEAAQWAVEAWDTWRQEVGFVPERVEAVVYCKQCGYAGTLDWVGKVKGVKTLGDIKTGKAIYPEALLQANAYRHALKVQGTDVEQAMILRLPKAVSDPQFEVMVAPEIPLRAVQAALTLWRAMRWLEGKPTGKKVGEMCAV